MLLVHSLDQIMIIHIMWIVVAQLVYWLSQFEQFCIVALSIITCYCNNKMLTDLQVSAPTTLSYKTLVVFA